jgi:GT2 family glycosyltransferase/glycosyltransferase involved in cell wall biosynthesis
MENLQFSGLDFLNSFLIRGLTLLGLRPAILAGLNVTGYRVYVTLAANFRNDNGKPVAGPEKSKNLVVLGMHRSGTSMIAGGLASRGLYAGADSELVPPAADNPRGFWERRDVVALNDALLAAADASWFRPRVLPASSSKAPAEIIRHLDSNKPWVLKDPRLVLTWSCWSEQLEGASLLYVYRDPIAVASSLRRRNGYPLEYGLALWEFYNRQALCILAAVDGVAVSYEAFMENPGQAWETLQARLEQAGILLDEDDARELVDPQLNHSTGTETDRERLTDTQVSLHEYCRQFCLNGELPGSLPVQSTDLVRRLDEFAGAYSDLADVAALRANLDATSAERDKAREDFTRSSSEYTELSRAHQRDVEELELLRDERNRWQQELDHLRESELELQAKSDHLYSQLDTNYLKLLAYNRSLVGMAGAGVATIYKLLRLRPGSRTAYDDVLLDAAEHVARHGSTPLEKPVTRSGLAWSVLTYLLRHPVASLRSFSWARLRRALSVFFGSSGEDLEVWVRQRFPEIDEYAVQQIKPQLDTGLDTLSLEFTVVEAPRVSIIIPVYNEYRMTMFCLRSLLANTQGVSYEIILADDASTDLTASIGQRVKGITVERASANQGFVLNCNMGAGAARGEYLLFLNNDTAFTENWLQAMVSVLDEDPTAGVVGPMLLFGNGRLQEAGGIVWDDASGWNYGRADEPSKPEYNYRKEVDYVSGACLLIRGELWQQLGGFDERYVPAYYEDTDLCFASRAAGYKVLYQPASRVYHFEGVSNGTDVGSGIKQHQIINQGKFLNKWRSTLESQHFPNAQQVFRARDRSRGQRVILVIDHYVPSYDKDAGSRSTWLYLQLMVEMGYSVKFIGANFFPHQPYTRDLQALGVEVLVGEHMARNLSSWLQEHAACIDVVYIHRPHVVEQFLAQLNSMQPRPRLIYFGHDLHFLRVERECQVTGDTKLAALAQEWKQRELDVFSMVDKVYFPSQVEVDVIRDVAPEVDVEAIPLYVLKESAESTYDWSARRDLLFVGGFGHSPNVDGLCWFVDEVLPLIWQTCPDLTLHVVGSNAPAVIRGLAGDRVQIHGYLSDEELEQRYSSARTVVVPLRFGAGVKGKVLEALQHGVPLVTTAVGAEGLPEPDSVFNIAESAEDFAAAVVELETGCSASLARLERYRAYLDQYFSHERASELLRRDFGDPALSE